MKTDKSAHLLKEAADHMAAGKFSRAFAALKELLAADPSNMEARRLLATLLLKFGNLTTAKAAFETLAKEALQRQDFKEAESVLREYLEAVPQCVPFLDLLGHILEAGGDALAAVFEYEKAIEVLLEHPDPDRPTYVHDLYEKIQHLAPSSFVANRVAAKLPPPPARDTETTEPATQPLSTPSLVDVPGSGGLEPEAAQEAEREVAIDPSPEPSVAAEHPSAVTMAVEETDEVRSTEAPPAHAPDDGGEVHVPGQDVQPAPLASPDPSAGIDHELDLEEELDEETDREPAVEPRALDDHHTGRTERDDRVPFPPVNRLYGTAQHAAQSADDPGPEHESPDDPVEDQQPHEQLQQAGVANDPTTHELEGTPADDPSEVESDAVLPSHTEEHRPHLERPPCDHVDAGCIPDGGGPHADGGGSYAPDLTEPDRGEAPLPSMRLAGDAPTQVSPARRRAEKTSSVVGAWLGVFVAKRVRRVVWATESFARLLMVLCAGAIGTVLVGSVLVIGTWLHLEENPSDLYTRLTQLTPPRILEDHLHNGYLLLLGFTADEMLDAAQVGYDRWLTIRADAEHGCYTHRANGYVEVSMPPGMAGTTEWFRDGDPVTRMGRDGSRLAEAWDPHGVRAARYRQWLSMAFDDWGYGDVRPVDCGAILATHRLYVADGFAQSLPAGLDRLETDVTAWRNVAAHARTLSMKALALSAVHDDVLLISGVLSRPAVDAKVVQRLSRLAKPMTAEERSLKWPLYDAFVVSAKYAPARLSSLPEEASLLAVAVSKMPLPKQRTLNAYAAYYHRLATDLTPVVSLYEFAHTPPRGWTDYVINPIDNVLPVSPSVHWEAVGQQIVELDARLRLAGLKARLRVPSSERNLAARVAQAGSIFFDPFTELPMLLKGSPPRLYSVGPDRQDDGADEERDLVVPLHLP